MDKAVQSNAKKPMVESEVRGILERLQVLPSRTLGQNFLVEPQTAEAIVRDLDLKPSDTVVEVGPGVGSLTRHFVERVERVFLIEYDSRLAHYLREQYRENDRVTVIEADAAKFDLRDLYQFGEVKLLGNLPYSAGGAILQNFMKVPTPVTRGVLMLQSEMVDRILAQPKTKAYGVLTLRMQAFWEMQRLRKVGPQSFFPRPAVDSTVMSVERKSGERPVFDYRFFDELVRRGFAQRRKKLAKNLPEGARGVLAEMGLSESVRAEELSVDEWIELTRCADPKLEKEEGQSPSELLTVVDEEDVVVGEATRAEIHEGQMLHRAVHVFVINRKGELFLQKRSKLKDVCPGLWDSSAAGHVDSGETYEECAKRELLEELGIEVGQVHRVGKLPATVETGWEFVELYGVRWDGAVRFPCVEIETGLWVTMNQARAWLECRPEDFAPGFLKCWDLWVHENEHLFKSEKT